MVSKGWGGVCCADEGRGRGQTKKREYGDGSHPAVRGAARDVALELGLLEVVRSKKAKRRHTQTGGDGDGEEDGEDMLTSEPPIVVAAAEGLISRVELLMDAGDRRDLEACGDNGFTALHQAVIGGHAELVDCLLERGANVEGSPRARITPLMQVMLSSCARHLRRSCGIAFDGESRHAQADTLNAVEHVEHLYLRMKMWVLHDDAGYLDVKRVRGRLRC